MNHILVVNKDKTVLNAFGRLINITCKVRNLANGERGRCEVVRTEPDPGVPYSPNVFPSGDWLVTAITAETDPDLAPWFIATDAEILVPVWELDSHGCYLKQTTKLVKDSAYGIHNSEDPHTLGCMRVIERADLLFLVDRIWTVWGGKVRPPQGDQVRVSV